MASGVAWAAPRPDRVFARIQQRSCGDRFSVFGLKEQSLAFVVLLHVGTLLATLWLFRDDLASTAADLTTQMRSPGSTLASPSGQLAVGIVVATIATVAVALALESRVEPFSHDLRVVGLCLLGSAAAVIATSVRGGESELPTLPQALVIGLVQGLAVLPGLSEAVQRSPWPCFLV